MSANTISLGIDIASSLLDVTVPGSSILATGLFNHLKRKWIYRKNNLKKLITKKSISNAESIELLTSWISYCFFSTEKSWLEFKRKIENFADRNVLVSVMCNILDKLGYSTLLILVDEADELLTNSSIRAALQNIRSIGSHSEHHLNIHFLFAGTQKIKDLKNDELYKGFSRRFYDPEQSDVTYEYLEQPIIKDSNDDITRAREKFDLLSSNFIDVEWMQINEDMENEIRERLKAKNEIRWSEFWTEIRKELEKQKGLTRYQADR